MIFIRAEPKLTTFEELLTTMAMMQKNNKSGWMDSSVNWGQSGGYGMLRCNKTVENRGKWVTLASRRESYLSFSILSSLEKMGVPGSGKPMVMK